MEDRSIVGIFLAAVVFVVVDFVDNVLLSAFIPSPISTIISGIIALGAAIATFLATQLATAFLGALVAFAVAGAGGKIRPKTSVKVAEMKFASIPFNDQTSSTHLSVRLVSKGTIVIHSINPEAPSFEGSMPIVAITNYLSTAGKKPVSNTSESPIDVTAIAFGWSLLPDPASASQGSPNALQLVKDHAVNLFYPSHHQS